MLLNERVRSINNMITMFNSQIHICINYLESRIDKETMEDCNTFINEKRERRHCKTLERWRDKFNQLWQRNTDGCLNIKHGRDGYGCSNNISEDTITTSETASNQNQNLIIKKWVHNLSKTPLTRSTGEGCNSWSQLCSCCQGTTKIM